MEGGKEEEEQTNCILFVRLGSLEDNTTWHLVDDIESMYLFLRSTISFSYFSVLFCLLFFIFPFPSPSFNVDYQG